MAINLEFVASYNQLKYLYLFEFLKYPFQYFFYILNNINSRTNMINIGNNSYPLD